MVASFPRAGHHLGMETKSTPPWIWLKTPPPHHRRFAEGDFWLDRTIADAAYALAEKDPAAPAFLNVGRPASREMLLKEAEALSVSLRELGVSMGDVVSFQTPNWIEAAVINLSAAMSGFVVNPIVPIYRDAEVRMMLADCRAKVFFVAESFRRFDFASMAQRLRAELPALEHVAVLRGERGGLLNYDQLVDAGQGVPFERPRVDPGAVKMLLYTSGTTGRPKGVLHSHNTLTRAVRRSMAHWGVKPEDAIIMPSPVTHVSGYSNGLEAPFISETKTVLMESWNAQEALALI